MHRFRLSVFAALAVCVGLCLAPSCDDFTVTLHFVQPDKAELSESQDVSIAPADEVHVSNDIGATRVTVDPSATQIKVEVLRTAWAATPEDAQALLGEMQVTVGNAGGIVTIDALMPAIATSDQADFQIEFTDDDSVNITALLGDVQVSTYRLRVTLPPGHAVKVDQGIGTVRTIGLDSFGEITVFAGDVIASACQADLRIDSRFGDVEIRNHRGSLDVAVASGFTELEVDLLQLTDGVRVESGSGDIRATFEADVEADLFAEADDGRVDFRVLEFDEVDYDLLRWRKIEAELNDGGAEIRLTTRDGNIEIHGH